MEELKYKTGLKRFWSAIVDGIVFLPLVFVDNWIHQKTGNGTFIFIWAALYNIALLFYTIILHYKYGQTIGKWVVGIKVVDVSEARKLTLRQAILRDIFYVIITFAGIIYFCFLRFQSASKFEALEEFSTFGNGPILIWTMIELITMLTNYKRRAIHDFLAKSVVVRAENDN